MSENIQTLLDYHIWANRQVWDCIESLTHEQYVQEHQYSAGSLYNQMFHIAHSDWFTTFALKGIMPGSDEPTNPKKEDYPDRPALRAKWDQLEAGLRDFVAGISVEEWHTPLAVPIGDGKTTEITPSEIFYASVNHGTNHRAQVLALISQLGGKTVEQGFFFYLMQR